MLHTFWCQSSIYDQEPMVLARSTSDDKKTLAREVNPLAQGYRTDFHRALHSAVVGALLLKS